MRVNKIHIRQILGIEDLEIKPGALTVIKGSNGTGKTSVMEAIKGVIKGGHDATLLRNGAEHGEVVFVLDNGIEIHKKVSREKSKTDVIDPKLGKISKPATYIESLTDALTVNPVAFLTAPKTERLKVLLEAMPVVVDKKALDAIAPPGVDKPTSYDLTALNILHDDIYTTRRDVSRDLKSKEATIAELSESLPEGGVDKDWSAEAEELEARAEALRDEQRSKYEEARQLVRDKEDEVSTTYVARKNEIHNEYIKKLGALDRRKEAETEKNNDERLQKTQAIDKSLVRVADTLDKEYGPRIEQKTTALATAKQKAEEQVKARHTQRIIDGFVKGAETLDLRVTTLSGSLVDLDALKRKTLDNLPIKGIEIKDGEIYRDGVTFDRLNTAQQIAIAVDIARLRVPGLGLMCVDGLEKLDAKHIKQFKEAIEAAGLQAIVTMVVPEGPLYVTDNCELPAPSLE